MVLVINKKKSDHLVTYVHQRVYKKNKNFICFFSGPTGSGKTYSALRFAEKLDSDFTMENVVFDAKEFMNLLNGNPKELKQGSVILWEEIQTSMGHMDYQSFVSKAINYVLTTFRHKNLILIVTAPYFSFINASSRKLFHCVFEVQRINYEKNCTISKPLFLQINQRTGKTYFKYLQVARGDGTTPQIKLYSLGLPSQSLLEAYEKRKAEFTATLNDSILAEIDTKMQLNSRKTLTGKQEQILNLLKDRKSPQQISQIQQIDDSVVYSHMKSIEKKGYILVKQIDSETKAVYYEVRE